MRPYDLRHAYVSLMIQAGHTVVEVAKWAGHSPQVDSPQAFAKLVREFLLGNRAGSGGPQ